MLQKNFVKVGSEFYIVGGYPLEHEPEAIIFGWHVPALSGSAMNIDRAEVLDSGLRGQVCVRQHGQYQHSTIPFDGQAQADFKIQVALPKLDRKWDRYSCGVWYRIGWSKKKENAKEKEVYNINGNPFRGFMMNAFFRYLSHNFYIDIPGSSGLRA